LSDKRDRADQVRCKRKRWEGNEGQYNLFNGNRNLGSDLRPEYSATFAACLEKRKKNGSDRKVEQEVALIPYAAEGNKEVNDRNRKKEEALPEPAAGKGFKVKIMPLAHKKKYAACRSQGSEGRNREGCNYFAFTAEGDSSSYRENRSNVLLKKGSKSLSVTRRFQEHDATFSRRTSYTRMISGGCQEPKRKS